MHLMQDHPALSTPSPAPIPPLSITFPPPLHFPTPPPPLFALSSFSFNESARGPLGGEMHYWEMCCVRLARFVLLMFVSFAGSVWVSNTRGGSSLRWMSFWSTGRKNKSLFFFLFRDFMYVCDWPFHVQACKDMSLSDVHMLRSVVRLQSDSPPLSQGQAAWTHLAAWNIIYKRLFPFLFYQLLTDKTGYALLFFF